MLAPRVDDNPGPRLVANQAGVMIQRDRQDDDASVGEIGCGRCGPAELSELDAVVLKR